MIVAALILAIVATTAWRYDNGAEIVTDLDRPSARIKFVGLQNPEPQPNIRTLAFSPLLEANMGRTLNICIRDRATKGGALWVDVGGNQLRISTPISDAYHLYCAPFVVKAADPVDVSNTGYAARVDFIRHVSIREVS